MGKNLDPESGIRDKHPGSATLQKCHFLGWQFRQGLESKRESEGLHYFFFTYYLVLSLDLKKP